MDPWLRTRAEALLVDGDRVFWSVGCGDDFSPPQSEVASAQFSGGTPTVHYRPDRCELDRVASASVAVDDTTLYWLTGNGQVVSMPRASVRATPSFVCAMAAPPAQGWPRADGIVSLGESLYWNEGGVIYSVPKSGGTRQRLVAVSGATGLRKIAALDANHLVFLNGNHLTRVAIAGDLTPQVLGENVFCFAVGDGRLVWAATAPGTPTTHAVSALVTGGDVTTHYTTDGHLDSHRQVVIDAVAIDHANVYIHELKNVTGGPILRVPRTARQATAMSDYLLGNITLAVGDGTLFFTDFNTGIYRIDVTAPAPTAPGHVWITGIETTQAIQTTDNRIPLLAGKRTFVRVYVQSQEDDRGAWTGVTARLIVDGAARAHGPLNSYTITVSPTGSDRRTLSDSFVFELDPEEISPGTRGFTIQVIPPPGRPTSTPIISEHYSIAFVDGGPGTEGCFYGVRYSYINVPADVQNAQGLSGPDWPARPWADFETDRLYAENYLPLARLYLQHYPGDPTPAYDYTLTGDPSVTPRIPLASWRGYLQARVWAERLIDNRPAYDDVHRIAILQPESSSGAYNGFTEHAPTYCINYWTNPEDPGNTFAHELGHSFGLLHTPDLMGYGGGSDYSFPRADGSLGPEVGLCYEPMLQPIPGTNADGSVAAYDLMSYRHSRSQQPKTWTSPYSYCKAMREATGRRANPTGIDGYTG